MAKCDLLVAYLQPLVPKQSSDTSSSDKQVGHSPNPLRSVFLSLSDPPAPSPSFLIFV